MRRGFMKIFTFASALIFSVTVLGQESAKDDLNSLVIEALANNPELAAMRSSWAAAQFKVAESAAIDPPLAGVEFYQVPTKNFPSLKDNQETDYFVSQMIPFPGKLYENKKSAKNSALMSFHDYSAAIRRVVADLKTAYYGLYFVQQKAVVNRENQKLLENFAQIARRQYEVGIANQADFLRAETELASLRKEGLAIEQERIAAEARLNQLLGRSGEKSFGEIKEIESDLPDWTFEQLMPIARENNHELSSRKLGVEMSRIELAYARQDLAPDFMLKGTYKDMEMSQDYWALMVGVTLPVAPWSGTKYFSRVRQSELMITKAEREYDNQENMVAADLRTTLAKISTGKRQLELYRNDLVPQAEQTLRSTISAYSTGKTEFLMVIDAYKMAQMAKIDYAMTRMNYMSSQAELEEIVGLSAEDIKAKVGQ
jgi:outer membrane protein TolC